MHGKKARRFRAYPAVPENADKAMSKRGAEMRWAAGRDAFPPRRSILGGGACVPDIASCCPINRLATAPEKAAPDMAPSMLLIAEAFA